MGILKRLCGAFIATAFAVSAQAQTAPSYPKCTDPGMDAADVQRIVYMNGVLVEPEVDAAKSVARMAEILVSGDSVTGEVGSPNHAVPRKFCFTVAYDPIGWGTVEKPDTSIIPLKQKYWDQAFQDVYEVLFMKQAEEFFSTSLRDLFNPHDGTSREPNYDSARGVASYLDANKLASLDNTFTREYSALVAQQQLYGDQYVRAINSYTQAVSQEEQAIASLKSAQDALTAKDAPYMDSTPPYMGFDQAERDAVAAAQKARDDARSYRIGVFANVKQVGDYIKDTTPQSGTNMASRIADAYAIADSVSSTIESDGSQIPLINQARVDALLAAAVPRTIADLLAPTVDAGKALASLLSSSTQPTILVAHSEGNLIAHMAYASALKQQYDNHGNMDLAKRVRIINIANTSQISINNLSLTNADDGVINILGSNVTALVARKVAAFNRTSPAFTLQDGTAVAPCNYAVCQFYTNKPSLGGVSRTTVNVADITALASQDDTLAVFKLLADVTLIEAEKIYDHLLVETYLSNTHVGVIETRGVQFTIESGPGTASSTNDTTVQSNPYTIIKDRFRDRFEDMVYAAVSSLDAAQVPLPAPNWQPYLTADFSTLMSNTFVTGNTQQTNDGVWQMILRGTGTFGVKLPQDQTAVLVRAHMYFSATSDTNTRFAYKMYSQDASIAQGLYLSMRYNSTGCANATSAYFLDGASGSWQCGTELPLDVARLATVGAVMFTAQYDRRDCTMRISIAPDDGSAAMGGTVGLTPAQCNNARINFSFTPGAQSTASMIRIYSLDVLTYKAP